MAATPERQLARDASVDEMAEAIGGQSLLSRDAPVGNHVQVTPDATVQTLTAPAGATALWIQTIGNNIRLVRRGTPAAAGPGFQLTPAMGIRMLAVEEGESIKYIREAAGAIVQYQWVG